MATDLFKGFTNPHAGETFRCISNTNETFVFEWTVQPGGHVPSEHIHYDQDETFRVKKGQLLIKLDGKEHLGNPGDTFTARKGQPHLAMNRSNDVLVCEVEFNNATETFAFFQCMGGLVLDGDYDRRGQVNIPKMCYFMKRMKIKSLTRPVQIPAPVFRTVVNIFYVAGVFAGWNKHYSKYTGID